METAFLLLEVLSDAAGSPIQWHSYPVGQTAIDEEGQPLPPRTLEASLNSDAVLLGAVGGRSGSWPESAVLGLRKELDVFANLRPVRTVAGVRTSLRQEIVEGADVLIVRESTSGAYFGEPKGKVEGEIRAAIDTTFYDEHQISRVARIAFEEARHRRKLLTSVDKANVLATSRLWREVVDEVSQEFPDVELEHVLADAASYLIVQQPKRFDVMLADNLFGDILSDVAGALVGSLGLLGSATIGDSQPGLFEPVHGSAPDIAGKGIANPLGMARTVALMLRYGFAMPSEANVLDDAVDAILTGGPLTPDLDSQSIAGTTDVAKALSEEFNRRLRAATPR